MYAPIEVNQFKHNNDDLTIVNAARGSFGKEHKKLTKGDQGLINTLVRENHLAPLYHPNFLFQMEMDYEDYMKFIQTSAVEELMFRISIIKVDTVLRCVQFFLRGSLYAFMKCSWNREVLQAVESKCPVTVAAFREHKKIIKGVWGTRNIIDHTDLITGTSISSIFKALKPWFSKDLDIFKLIPFSFRITAPCFVARQHFKSSVGIIRSEESRRYISDLPELFEIELRMRHESGDVKQGSSKTEVLPSGKLTIALHEHLLNALNLYTQLIEAGVAPECARQHLPQNAMFTWIETG